MLIHSFAGHNARKLTHTHTHTRTVGNVDFNCIANIFSCEMRYRKKYWKFLVSSIDMSGALSECVLSFGLYLCICRNAEKLTKFAKSKRKPIAFNCLIFICNCQFFSLDCLLFCSFCCCCCRCPNLQIQKRKQ